MSVPKQSPAERFMAKVRVQTTGCWEWQGYIGANGYGYFRHPETSWAHRASWLLHRGPIPEGCEIDHLCRNRRCVNPTHLDPVTPSINQQRAKPWTTCPTWHPETAPRWADRADGRTVCLECKRAAELDRRARRKIS